MLKSLPQSLDVTYEWMFCSIDDHPIEDARRTLTLLCFAYRPLTVEELIDGIAVDTHEPMGLNCSRRLQDVDDIRDICSGFVEIDFIEGQIYANDSIDDIMSVVRIAHFSVQEYLESTRILKSKAAVFGMHRASAHAEIAQICLSYLLDDGLRSPLFDRHLVEQFPLSHFAAMYWYRHCKDAAASDVKLESSVLSLFNNRQSIVNWIKMYDVSIPPRRGINFGRPTNDIRSSFCYASCLGLDKTLSNILSQYPAPSGILPSDPLHYDYGKSLHEASENGHQETVQVLLDKGVDVNTLDLFHGDALYLASSRGHQNIVQVSLDRGANVNTWGEKSIHCKQHHTKAIRKSYRY